MNHPLPEGVEIHRLKRHADSRGALYEMYREAWTPQPPFRQWNVVRSEGSVLRGVHVHPRHCDYLHVLEGSMLLGLHDLRPEDPAERISCLVELGSSEPCAAFIPPGVCHGFWFAKPTFYIYGLSTGWSMAEELGCRYDDPSLGLDWPAENPVLSPRDQSPSHDYAAMRRAWFDLTAVAAE